MGKKKKIRKVRRIHPKKNRPYRKRKKMQFGEFAKKLIKPLIIITVLLVLLFAGYFGLQCFRIENVIVEGNAHYTNDEIKEMVLGDKWGKNTLYVAMKYRNKQMDDIPFVEALDVEILSADSVKITVFEKALAGYIEYKGQYFYFDKDGTIVESSNVKTAGIPQIMGLSFDHIVVMEKLPVEDETVFMQILDVTKLLNKYGILAEKIYFDSRKDMTLYFGETRISLGNTDYIDEKIMKVKAILPEIEGKKGVLRLENYKADSTSVSFELENE